MIANSPTLISEDIVQSRPVAVLVLGMHRSGTSVLTRVLSLMGADLPDRLLPANDGNQTGYWESEELTLLQDELLQSAGLNWDDFAAFPEAWYQTPAAADFRRRLMVILRRDFGGSRLFVLKDPRLSVLVPLWVGLLEEFGVEPVFVISVRNPLEVAESLYARNKFLKQKSMLLWLRYMLDAQRFTNGMRRCHVAYDDVLTDWRGVVDHVSKKTGVIFPRTPDAAASEIDAFVAGGLRHQRAEPDALDNDLTVNHWVKEAYTVALAAARGDESSLVETNDRIHAAMETANVMFTPLMVEHRAATWRAFNLDRQLDAMAAGAPPNLVPDPMAVGDETRPDGDTTWLFHAGYYLEMNPDVAASGADPLAHFLQLGWKELRSPHPLFDLAFYRENYPDVAAAGVNPLRHFLTQGCAEGRSPNRLFDIQYYLGTSPDVVAAGINPVRHYIECGGREGRDPSPLFDGRNYIAFNPQYVELGVDPLSHYLWRGMDEGLSPLPLCQLAERTTPKEAGR